MTLPLDGDCAACFFLLTHCLSASSLSARTFRLESNESIRFVQMVNLLTRLQRPDPRLICLSGVQEVEWLKSQLKEKLRNPELDDSVRCDVQTLLTVLQCPVFGKIVTIEVGLSFFLSLSHLQVSGRLLFFSDTCTRSKMNDWI